MGSFFTNVQVSTKGIDEAEARARVVTAVREWITSQGWIEEGPGEPADREVVIGPAGPWISVYDQATESQDMKLIEGLASVLSQAAKTAAAGILVHDSDVLELRLCREGKVVDRYCSWPEYFEEVSRRNARKLSGKPEKWRELLVDDGNMDRLVQVWSGSRTFAEEVLADTAALLGWEQPRVMVGHRYLSSELTGAPESREGYTTLAFRMPRSTSESLTAEGPSSFGQLTLAPVTELSVGDPLELTATAQSAGGADEGLEVWVGGPALEQGLISIDEVLLRAATRPGKPGSDPSTPRVREEVGAFESDGTSRLDFAIPAGVGDIWSLAQAMPGAMQQATERMISSQVYLILRGTVHSPGSAELEIEVAPLGNLEEGAAGAVTTLRVSPAPRRPSPMPPAPVEHIPGQAAAMSAQLRAMETPSTLFALIALGLDREECGPLAAEAFERWHSAMHGGCGGQPLELTLMQDVSTRAETLEIRAETLARAKPWKRLREELSSCLEFSATVGSPVPSGVVPGWVGDLLSGAANLGARLERRYGFALHTTLYPSPAAREGAAVHLGFWLDISGEELGGTEAEELLGVLMDELMGRGMGHQAILGKWAWSPGLSAALTPYEQVCGVYGYCTTQRDWITRYLRGVTPTMWLCEELWRHIDQPSRLSEVVTIEPVGDARRLDLRDDKTLDDLEKVLAPLLPNAEACQEMTQRLHR